VGIRRRKRRSEKTITFSKSASRRKRSTVDGRRRESEGGDGMTKEE
jgi:hypothetical protein